MGLGATIRVHRSQANLRDLGISYTLMIDEADAGQIWSRRTRTFEVSPGIHELEVRLLWIRRSRLEFLLSEGEERNFACKTFVSVPREPRPFGTTTRGRRSRPRCGKGPDSCPGRRQLPRQPIGPQARTQPLDQSVADSISHSHSTGLACGVGVNFLGRHPITSRFGSRTDSDRRAD
jgi:hypothetical protein